MNRKSANSPTHSIDGLTGSGHKSGGEVTHGWKPERGFLKYRWEGYDEALLLYILLARCGAVPDC